VHSSFLTEVRELFESQFERLDEFQAEFRDLFNLFWREKNSNLEVLREPRLRKQEKVF
jgi:hypothetical protein